MKTRFALVMMLFWCGISHHGVAQTLASRSFDLLFTGDDPTEHYDFPLTLDPLTPVAVRFTGFFENLLPEETGVRSGLSWFLGAGAPYGQRQFTDEMGVRLPAADPVLGTTRVPFSFDQQINFTPSETQFWVEGLGPGDRFRFVGKFTIQAVPEPSITLLLFAAAAGTLLYFRRSLPA